MTDGPLLDDRRGTVTMTSGLSIQGTKLRDRRSASPSRDSRGGCRYVDALVHCSHIVREHQCEGAGAGRHRAGERAATKDFYRRVVGEGDVVVGGAEGFAERFQLFISTDKLHGVDFRD